MSLYTKKLKLQSAEGPHNHLIQLFSVSHQNKFTFQISLAAYALCLFFTARNN